MKSPLAKSRAPAAPHWIRHSTALVLGLLAGCGPSSDTAEGKILSSPTEVTFTTYTDDHVPPTYHHLLPHTPHTTYQSTTTYTTYHHYLPHHLLPTYHHFPPSTFTTYHRPPYTSHLPHTTNHHEHYKAEASTNA